MRLHSTRFFQGVRIYAAKEGGRGGVDNVIIIGIAGKGQLVGSKSDAMAKGTAMFVAGDREKKGK